MLTHAVWFMQCSGHLSTRCMMSIFSDIVEQFLETFMDDFSIYGSSFDAYLSHLEAILTRRKEKRLVRNWENVTLWSNVALY